MSGYYLWDWYGSKTIRFDTDIEFDCDKYARDQDCFRRFADAKKAGLCELKESMAELKAQIEALERLTIQDVKGTTP